jgi:hypothetical protein
VVIVLSAKDVSGRQATQILITRAGRTPALRLEAMSMVVGDRGHVAITPLGLTPLRTDPHEASPAGRDGS